MTALNNRRRYLAQRIGSKLLVLGLTSLFCTFASRPAHGEIAFVQNLGTNTSKGSPGTSLSLVLGSAVTDGNSLIITFAADTNATSNLGLVTATDDAVPPNVYNLDVDVENAGNVHTAILSALDVSGLVSGRTITVMFPNAVDARAMSVSEFSGLGALDRTNSITQSASPYHTGNSGPTTESHELVIGAVGLEGPVGDSFTPDPLSGWTALSRDGTTGNPPAGNITINPLYQIVWTAWSYPTGMAGTGPNRDSAGAIATYTSEFTSVFTRVGTLTASGPAQTITVGFRPKAVIFFWTSQTAAGWASHSAAGYGFAADNLTQRAVVFSDEDNLGTTVFNARSRQTQNAILMATGTPPTGGATVQGQLIGMTDDGFQLGWDGAIAPYLIHYLAIGGGDVGRATVGTDIPPACAPPCSGSFTGVNFQPDFLMFLSIDHDSYDTWVDGPPGSNANGRGARVSLGFAGESQGAITQGATNATAMDRGQQMAIGAVWQRSDRAILERDARAGGGSRTFAAQVTSFDADGFTVSIPNFNADRTNFHYLALKGGQYNIGTLLKPGSTGSQSYTGVGYTPHGLAFVSKNMGVSTATGSVSGRISFSAADGPAAPTPPPNQAATFFASQTDFNPPDFDNSWVRQSTSTSKVIYLAQPGDCPLTWPEGANPLQCSAGPRVTADADVTAYGADGFTLNWTTADTVNVNEPANENNAEIIYVAFGEDELTTAVELLSFEAQAGDGTVELSWETGSEIDNLGFHLYRSSSEEGPYQRITASVIPGLGSSPEGARYQYVDEDLTNGVTYFYKLEDIETTGKTELHGPVSATPEAGLPGGDNQGGEEGSGDGSGESTSRIVFGDPDANRVNVRRRDRRGVEIELWTEGFYAYPEEDGTVRLEVPDFVEAEASVGPDIPVYRSWLEAIAGRQVNLVSVETENVQRFASLQPSFSEAAVIASPDGVVRAGRRNPRSATSRGHARSEFRLAQGFYPEEWARLVSVGFQGDVKKALVELAPLRRDGSGGLVLARRMVVRLSFVGRDVTESFVEGRGRGDRDGGSVLARLALSEPGLYGVSYESVYGALAGDE
jgi:hypothetical protein